MPKSPQQHGRGVYLCISIAAVCALWVAAGHTRVFAQDTAPGGFVESDSSTAARPLLSASQIGGFLPTRGRFTFPAPYQTQGIRLTNATDCAGGSDCLNGVGYSYWRNINNSAGSDTMLIMLGLMRTRGGAGPTLFTYNKVTGETKNAGPIFPDTSPYSWATGEGWYFSATAPTMLYLNDGPKMLRYDVISKQLSTVFDATSAFGANRYIWQMHSSNDDRVHSFTLRDSSTYTMLGCGVYLENLGQFRFFAAMADFDECQVDKSGRYVVIKEQTDGQYGEDNVIEDLQTGTATVLLDQNGAGGHSDLGFGYQVAEDNFASLPGSVRVWSLGAPPADGSQGRLVFHATDWAFGSNHIAHSNARPDLTWSQQYACSSSANRLNLPRSNEVLCYRLDGSLQTLVVAPVMTNMDAAGGGTDEYWKLPKGNIDPTGEYFIWTTNFGGNRLDAVMVRIPVGLLPAPIDGAPVPVPPSGGTGGTTTGGTTTTPITPPPTTDPAPIAATSTPTAVNWISQVNAAVANDTLTKQGGCDGCADSGAISAQQIVSGDGYLEFTVSDTLPMRFIGLSHGNRGTTGEEINYALRLQNNNAEVRENGTYRTDVRIKTGDVLRVQISGGKIQYARNGKVFYTSGVAPAYPLLVDSALYSSNSTLYRATIAATGSTSTGGTTTPVSPPTTVLTGVTWMNLVNTSLVNAALTKTSGCNGCPDAGAVSQQRIVSGNGYVEFKGGTGFYVLGLDSSTTPQTVATLPFALRLQSGDAEVREAGVYKTDVRFTATDTFRITVGGGKVVYAKNGVAFWTTTASVGNTLGATVSIYDLNLAVATPIIAVQ